MHAAELPPHSRIHLRGKVRIMNYLYALQALGSLSNFQEMKECEKIEVLLSSILINPKEKLS